MSRLRVPTTSGRSVEAEPAPKAPEPVARVFMPLTRAQIDAQRREAKRKQRSAN